MAGLVPAISFGRAQCPPDPDHPDKPGEGEDVCYGCRMNRKTFLALMLTMIVTPALAQQPTCAPPLKPMLLLRTSVGIVTQPVCAAF